MALLALFSSFVRACFVSPLYSILNLFPMGYPDVQQSVQQAADLTGVRLCCDKKREDDELRLKS